MTHTVSQIITDDTLNHIIQIESAGRPKIKARTSSATGLNQFVNGTWRATVRTHRPDLLAGRTDQQLLDLRLDPALNIELGARFAEDNARKLGAGYTPGDLYLAHFLGIGDAQKLFRAASSTLAEKVVSKKAVEANESILRGKTCAQVRAWASRKMAGALTDNWIAKFYKKPAVAPKSKPVPAEADPVKVDTIEDIAEPIDPVLTAQKDRPVIAAEEIPYDETVFKVQCQLRDLGYYVTGEPDGRLGPSTKDAILIFRRNNSMALSDAIDDEFLARLATAQKKPVTDKRATATAKDLPDNKTVQASWLQKVGAYIVGIPAAIGGFFSGFTRWFGDALDQTAPLISSLKVAFGSIPGPVIFGGIAAFAVFIFWNARAAEKDTVENYQKAKLL